MRNPFKREPSQDPTKLSPEEAIRLAQEGLAKSRTMRDSSGRRVKIPDELRAQMEGNLERVAQARATAAPAPVAADPEADRLARLEKLATLHSSGALTDEEFAAEKARVLDAG